VTAVTIAVTPPFSPAAVLALRSASIQLLVRVSIFIIQHLLAFG
jgi:hypothetical protein